MKANIYIREVEPRFKKAKRQDPVKICRSKDAYQLFCDMEDAVQEKLVCLHLAADNSVVCFQVVHIGTINFAVVNPADILRTTLLTGATGIVILHNHPSGEAKPSPDDKKMLQELKRACKLFQILLLDSLIISKDKYYSAADAGELLRKEQGN